MITNFKIDNYWIIALCILLGPLSSFAQELTDQEIGFNMEQAIAKLKERGLTDPQELNWEIQSMRERQTSEYFLIKKIENEILQNINLQQNPKGVLLKVAADIPQLEKDALLALYNSTNGSGWTKKTGWDFTTPVITGSGTMGWYGVTVSNGHIISLTLRSNNLIGSLPKEMAELKYLNSMDLSNNQLTGSIASEIGQLENLTVLNLEYNILTNIPPEIGQLKKLQFLSLANNKLTGTIPAEIGMLENLTSLNLGSIKLNYNNLIGGIPKEIGLLKKLQVLNLGFNNNLGGTIPTDIWDLTQIKNLTLKYLGLSGTLPSEIRQISEAVILNLENNKLTGAIPPEIGSLSKLSSLYLNYNQFTGSIPIEITRLADLNELYLNNNKLAGSIPKEIGQLSNLSYLDLGSNQLAGSVPSEINNLTKLSQLSLSTNLLEGKIPDLTNLPLKCRIRVQYEKFRFIDFAPQFISTNKDIVYRYQALIDEPKTITGVIGGHITMTMYEDNNYLPEETFQWYKGSTIIPNAITRQYTITNVTKADAAAIIASPDILY